MIEKITIFIQTCPTDILVSFTNSLKVHSDVVVQTATKDTITYFEKQNTFTKFPKVVYVGDEKEYQIRVQTAGGIYFSTIDIDAIKNPTSYTRTRELVRKIRKLKKWEINLDDIINTEAKN